MEHRAVRVRTRVTGAEPTLTANSLERLCFRKTRSREISSGEFARKDVKSFITLVNSRHSDFLTF